jgi:phosphoglycolate phosphatase-like HAD superfamily hydrolase
MCGIVQERSSDLNYLLPTLNMPYVFVIDWSGVISDDRSPVFEANMELLKHYGKPTMTFEEWLPRTTMTPVEFVRNSGVHASSDEIWNLYKDFFDNEIASGNVPTVYPDAKNVLRYLQERDKLVVVLSSHPEDNLRKEAEDYEVLNLLDFIVANSKGKAQDLKSIYTRFKKDPKSVMYVGDTIFDIRAAKEVGVISAGVCTGYHTRERLEKENPRIILETLSDIMKPGKLDVLDVLDA